MKIFHIFKEAKKDADFRLAILSAIQSAKTLNKNAKIKVFIASGFFDQSKANILQYPDPKLNIDLYSALQGLDVELFGAFYGSQELMNVKRVLLNNVSSLKVFYKNKFHAKIFVITVDDRIVFEIIGSSNMTNPAYKGLSSSGFSSNVESDLIVVDEAKCQTDISVSRNIIQFSYNELDNNGITLYERTKSILDYLTEYKKQMREL